MDCQLRRYIGEFLGEFKFYDYPARRRFNSMIPIFLILLCLMCHVSSLVLAVHGELQRNCEAICPTSDVKNKQIVYLTPQIVKRHKPPGKPAKSIILFLSVTQTARHVGNLYFN